MYLRGHRCGHTDCYAANENEPVIKGGICDETNGCKR